MTRGERQRILNEHAALYARESEASQTIARKMTLRQKEEDLESYRQCMERCREIERMDGSFAMGG